MDELLLRRCPEHVPAGENQWSGMFPTRSWHATWRTRWQRGPARAPGRSRAPGRRDTGVRSGWLARRCRSGWLLDVDWVCWPVIRSRREERTPAADLRTVARYFVAERAEVDCLRAEEEEIARELESSLKSIPGKTGCWTTLTAAEVAELVVNDKWMASVEGAIGQQVERPTGGLVDRVRVLEGRYAKALPELAHQVEDYGEKGRRPPEAGGAVGMSRQSDFERVYHAFAEIPQTASAKSGEQSG